VERTILRSALAASFVFASLICACDRQNNGQSLAAHERVTVAAQRTKALLKASNALEDLVQRSENTIPSAILNRTECLVFVPQPSTSPAEAAPAIESCRAGENSWKTPQLLEFRPSAKHPLDPGDLLFLLDENASRKLLGANLILGKQSRAFAGPTIRDVNLATNAELNQDIWMYLGKDGRLLGKTVPGTLVSPHGSEQKPETAFEQMVMESRAGNPTARFQAAVISFFNTITPTGIIIHHSGVIPSSNKVPQDERQVDRFHEERGFETICFGRFYHVAYHFLILPSGEVQVGRPERCQGAHASGYNSYLGISLIGDFSSVDNPRGAKGNTRPTARQLKSLVLLCRRLTWSYEIPLQRILRHSDVSPTLCPGDRFPFTSFLQLLERQQ
jgi:hypothetical protein